VPCIILALICCEDAVMDKDNSPYLLCEFHMGRWFKYLTALDINALPLDWWLKVGSA